MHALRDGVLVPARIEKDGGRRVGHQQLEVEVSGESSRRLHRGATRLEVLVDQPPASRVREVERSRVDAGVPQRILVGIRANVDRDQRHLVPVREDVVLQQLRRRQWLDVDLDPQVSQLTRDGLGDLLIWIRVRRDQGDLEGRALVRAQLGGRVRHPARRVQRLGRRDWVVGMEVGRGGGVRPVGSRDRVGVGVRAARQHLVYELLPVDSLDEREPDPGVAEELLSDAVGVEAHERAREHAHLLDCEVGPALQRVDLLRLDAAHEVGGAGQHGPDGALWIVRGIGAEDQMIEVRLRSGVRVAIQRDRERTDRTHLERPSAERAHRAVRARGDLVGRHALEDVLGDDANPQRDRE